MVRLTVVLAGGLGFPRVGDKCTVSFIKERSTETTHQQLPIQTSAGFMILNSLSRTSHRTRVLRRAK
jgi:hypothetical protein